MEGADESTELFLPPIVWNRTEKVIQVETEMSVKKIEKWRKKERKKERSEKER